MKNFIQVLSIVSVMAFVGFAHAETTEAPGACPHWSQLCPPAEEGGAEGRSHELSKLRKQAAEIIENQNGGVCCSWAPQASGCFKGC